MSNVPSVGGLRSHRPTGQALLRGLRGRCPNCGEGQLFGRFLKVVDQCAVCNEPLHHHRADDAPAYFVIFIVGHIVVPLAFAVEIRFWPPYWVQLAIWIPATIALALAFLQPVKGAIVGVQWANYMHGFGGEDVAEARAVKGDTGERSQ